ncbi:MAG TPA: DUF3180 domain-containing protein [Streptosporangiaceae bacterium]|nr:DUF3180 domain-containing protein [Streptosporangiaceae bacterium]
MQPTKWWSLLVVAAVSAALAWVAALVSFANLPPLPWTAVPALALLAVGEVVTGRNLRARLRRKPGTKPVAPLAVPRVVALAKASSVAAAAFGGLAAGFAIYVLPTLDKPVPRHDALAAASTALAAIALVAAALYLERSCRTPEPPDDADQPAAGGQRGRRS